MQNSTTADIHPCLKHDLNPQSPCSSTPKMIRTLKCVATGTGIVAHANNNYLFTMIVSKTS